MSPFTQSKPEKHSAFGQAPEWQLKLADDPSLEMSAEFQKWISDPANRDAFNSMNLVWAAGDDFALEPAILKMREDALRRARQSSIRRWRRPDIKWRAAAALIFVCLLSGGTIYYWRTAPVVYSTKAGERLDEILPDKSHIMLDSDSEIHVKYLPNARILTLDHGRARFDVAHDIDRPFRVTAGNKTVVAVGTSFEVEKIGKKVLVTLIQGKVIVEDPKEILVSNKKQHSSISLKAGQQLISAGERSATVEPADLRIVNAWEEGRLVFNGSTLGEAVVRVNRYTNKPIEIDPSIASIRIIGDFNAGDIASFVGAITSYFPVEATTTADNRILLRPRS